MGRDTLDQTTLVDRDVRAIRTKPSRPAGVLVRIADPGVGLTFDPYPIPERGLLIGRNPQAEGAAQIDDHRASRKHAQLKWIEALDDHVVCDLKSTNGTFHNGVQVDRERLSPGDVLRTGNSLFVYCEQPPEEPGDQSVVVGRSRAIRESVASLEQVAPTDLKVLIMGETGTGKELAAQTVHRASGRQGPFVPVNCGSFPATLIESELFGHVKGAFSGADRSKEGLIASAHKGTLFLDEIGEFPIDLQPRLLRVLQDQEVRPVGATSSKRVDVRIIAATNRDVFEMVEGDRFRRDLLARLNEWPVPLPPLRARREDVGLLIRHFLRERQAEEYAVGFDPDLLELMLLYPWSSNVRELGAAVARLAVSLNRGIVDTELLVRRAFGVNPPPLPERRPVPVPPDETRLRRALALFEGNISGVARYYGKERQQVYRWLERFGISVK